MILFQKTIVIAMSDSTFEERWKHIVFNKNITEEESLKFYETWAATVSTGCPRSKRTILNSYCGQAIDFKEPKNEICARNKRTFCFLREFEKLKKKLKSVILAQFDVGGYYD